MSAGRTLAGRKLVRETERKTHYVMKHRNAGLLLYHIMYNYVDTFLASEREKFNFSDVFVGHYGMCSPRIKSRTQMTR